MTDWRQWLLIIATIVSWELGKRAYDLGKQAYRHIAGRNNRR